MVIIRPESRDHEKGVRRVEEQAFKRAAEANLVEQITQRGGVTISLVAVEDGEVVGHVLFTPVTIGNGEQPLEALGLGPVAVMPSHQRQGIGSRLIQAGLEEARQAGHPAVVVLGAQDYYTRFGFEPARRYDIHFEDDSIPEEHFMVIELRRGALEGHNGVVRYAAEFKDG